MKKYFSLLVVSIIAFAFNTAMAESTVYLFLKSLGNTDVGIAVNGKNVCDMNAAIKKTMNNEMFKVPLKLAKDCTRKLIFNKEGKVVISATLVYTNPMKNTKNTMKGETQLDLVDGETYYVEITNKGLTDVQLKIMEDKKGVKRLAQKKRDVLSDVTIE